MTAQANTLIIVRGATRSSARIELKQYELHRLDNASLRIRVVQGTAWVTSEAEDSVLRAGEVLDVPRQRFPAVISATSIGSMVFEVERV